MTAAPPIPSAFDEAAARRVLLVQAYDQQPADEPLWTPEDRSWATRLARETAPAGTPPEHFFDERARHALQRLAPRSPAIARLLKRRPWRARWVLVALLLAFVCGVAVDTLGGGQRINLLAPPVWGVILWNLLVYLLLPWPLPQRFRRWMSARLSGTRGSTSALLQFRALWMRTAAPLLTARAALLLHGAAAGLALGLIAGLYLRGLVLDYRAAWQSTFLDAATVQGVLAVLLAPASALTGIAVPDVAAMQALRVGPAGAPVAGAAPWIHLYAAMLVLFVVIPRTWLALAAAWRAGRWSRRFPLPLAEPYFQRLLREQDGRAAQVQVLPHGIAPTPHALACLRAVLAPALGATLQVTLAAPTAYGVEEGAASLAAPAGTTLRLALLDLAATPEDDSHGAFVSALRGAAPAVPLLALADETAFAARFAGTPARMAERRAAWQKWARSLGVPLVCVHLAQPDIEGAEDAVQAALQQMPAA